ncbi:unnamed protein product [Schistocephalus solidus]|uniref:DHC_N1 domain-containing protein n=1 Tax=Schistocephalus solidus TaxID=70667 RepID=A0A183T9Y3_SCHSO|nr:unnamed protein product [Schistocephalus solidus]
MIDEVDIRPSLQTHAMNIQAKILELDPGKLNDIRQLLLDHMDTIQSKVGGEEMFGKSFNFLNLFKTAMQRLEGREPGQVPQLDRLFVQALLSDMKRMMNELSKLTAVERMLWLTLPENYEQLADTYREIWNMVNYKGTGVHLKPLQHIDGGYTPVKEDLAICGWQTRIRRE